MADHTPFRRAVHAARAQRTVLGLVNYEDSEQRAPFDLRRRRCRPSCDHSASIIALLVKRNATVEARRVCSACFHDSWGGGIKLRDLDTWWDYPVYADLRNDRAYAADKPTTCQRCGGHPVHEHHWAPVHLFGWDEANQWPTGYLCQPCHTEWHRLVTPNMHKARAS